MLRHKEIKFAGPNIYARKPVDELKKKEILSGLEYVIKKRVKKVGRERLKNRLKLKRIARRIKGRLK